MMLERFSEKIDAWVANILAKPNNIATELELREQSNVAIGLFLEADVDSSQCLSFEELKLLCDTAGLPMEEDEEESLMKMDCDDSGSLDVEEWVKWWLGRISTLPNPIKQQEAIARNTFQKFDSDNSGSLDAAELGKLTSALGANFNDEELEEAVAEIDVDNSGIIDVVEFIGWWTNRAASNRNNTTLISLKMRKLALKAAQVFSTDIFAAAWSGDADLVKAFLLGESRLAQAADTTEHGEGWTALHYACYQGHVEVVLALLAARPDVNRTNDFGFSALFYAAQRGHIAICSLLMEAGADPSVTGVYQPMGPLESDGPPPVLAATSTASATAAAAADPPSEPNQRNEIFMCPVEHMIDYPELRPIFKSSPKCGVPQAPDYAAVVATVNVATGAISFDVQQPQKSISHLPVKEWELKVRMDMQMDTELVPAEAYADLVGGGLSLVQRVPAAHPKQPQNYVVPLDRVWVKKLHFLCSLHKMKRLQLLEASVAGLQAIWNELCAIYGSIDANYQANVSLVDFVYILINKCPDKKSTKELRHGLRAALEQVTINNSRGGESAGSPQKPAARAGANKRGAPTAESKDPEPGLAVDISDPVARVNAAIREMQVRHAAAEQVLAAQQEQLKKGSTAASATAGAPPESSPTADTNSRAVKWLLQEDHRTGFPTVTMSLSAVNAWGPGDFSSSISATIHTSKMKKSSR